MTDSRLADLRRAVTWARLLEPTAGVHALLADWLDEALEECRRLRLALHCEWCRAVETGAPRTGYSRIAAAAGGLHRVSCSLTHRETVVACWAERMNEAQEIARAA